VAIATFAVTSTAAGQGTTATVAGVVLDSATRRPVAGAIVTLRSGDRVVPARTDEAGAFRIPRLPTGEVVAEVKRIGYRLTTSRLEVRADTTLTLVVAPAARALAPVNVFGKGEGVFGTIARSADLRPIFGAKVLVVGSGVTAITDSSGEFSVPLKHPGTYMVRVTADGYGEEVLPLTVRKNEVVESSQLLDLSDRKPLSAGLWDDFDQRLRWKPVVSALITGSELRAAGATVREALTASPSVIKAQLRLVPEDVCLFVNGQPRPGMTIDDFRVEDIRAIELYQGKDSIYISGLVKMWPPKLPCGSGLENTSRRPRGPNQAKVKWAVVWLR
jgi:hypothetical protein